MKKLELEHLVPYFPYKVKGIRQDGGKEIYTLSSIYYKDSAVVWKPDNFGDSTMIPMCLILRPLSDLTKEIEVNGKKFVPVEYFEDKYYTLDLHKQCLKLLENENWINQSDYMLIDYLFSWHFDVFGLIEQGLAIDINTLK